MSNVVRLHSRPLAGAVEQDVPDVLVPALAKLRACRDSIDVLVFLEQELPDALLAALTWHASRIRDIPSRHMKVLVKCAGDQMLTRALGRARARQLKTRFPVSGPYQALG